MPIPPLDGYTAEDQRTQHPVLPFIEQNQFIILILFFMFAGRIFFPVMVFADALRWLAGFVL